MSIKANRFGGKGTMQYHFVVIYDEASEKFLLDTGTTDAKFDETLIFDVMSGNWFTLSEMPEPDGFVAYSKLQDKLVEKLDGIY